MADDEVTTTDEVENVISESVDESIDITQNIDNVLPNNEDITAIEPSEQNTRKSAKKYIILGVIFVVIIAVAFALLPNIKLKIVENKALEIAGVVGTGKGYFTIDTLPEIYENMGEAYQAMFMEDALDAIKYANKKLGFSSAVYDQMLRTSALMGRQTEESNKYKVSWTYHPDEGLVVTYTNK